jgi:hypothetical protein
MVTAVGPYEFELHLAIAVTQARRGPDKEHREARAARAKILAVAEAGRAECAWIRNPNQRERLCIAVVGKLDRLRVEYGAQQDARWSEEDPAKSGSPVNNPGATPRDMDGLPQFAAGRAPQSQFRILEAMVARVTEVMRKDPTFNPVPRGSAFGLVPPTPPTGQDGGKPAQ